MPSSRRTLPALALLWGFAEATLFFLVPDVFISFVVIRSGWRCGLACAISAALGAAMGGLAMYIWAVHAPEAARAAVAAVPAIDVAMVERADRMFAAGGYWAILLGSFGGVPYKLYAVAAGAQHRPWVQFVVLTPLIRLPRFLLALMAAAVGDHLASRWLPTPGRLALLAGFWVVFYSAYFAIMPVSR